MVGVLVRRVITLAPLLVIISLVSFLLLKLVPGDPAVAIAGPDASAQLIEQTRTRLGLDRSLFAQYADYLGNLLRGDLGQSLSSGLPVWTPISERLGVTLSLTFLAIGIAVVIGVPIGLIAGARPGGAFDRIATVGSSFGIAMPHFWLGAIFISLFADQLWLLPQSGYVPLLEDPLGWAEHLVLPASALAAATVSEIARQTRAAVGNALEEGYVRTALGKGLTTTQVLFGHVLKNVAIPVVTVLGLQIGRVFGGSVVVEVIFNLHGLGELTVTSVARRDMPMVQGILMISAVIVLLANLVVDLSYRWLDPKLREA